MVLFLFFNELSTKPLSADFDGARQRMSAFIALFRELSQQFRAASPALRLHDALDQQLLAQEYSVADWLNDPLVPRDEKSRFRVLSTKYPYVSSEEFPDLRERDLVSALIHDGQEALGLKSAFLNEQIAVSFASSEALRSTELSCTLHELVDDGDVGIEEKSVAVRHLSHIDELLAHQEWLGDILLKEIDCGEILWEKREEYFPQLEFCQEVERQLKDLDTAWVKPVFYSLFELNRAYKSWDWKGVIPDSIGKKVTPESARTLDEFRHEHTFQRANGEMILFDWHLRFTPGAGRIFFHTHNEDRVCVIGHIGGKLPNSTY